jgi:hypothetical protein
MRELICDQSYTWDGVPADKSPYHNDGFANHTDGSFNGAQPGSGVITFPHPDSRVRIATGIAWQPLIALEIEMLVRVDPMAQRMPVLVAGEGSFSFGLLEGALVGSFVNATGNHNFVRSADQFAPDNIYHPVPANKWVRLGFQHDGFANMRLYIEGKVVGQTIVEDSIPPVQGLGVSIGNDVNQDGFQFPGEIDELRIWRLDPKTPKRLLLNRPYTRRQANCWLHYWQSIRAWVTNNPEQNNSLVNQIRDAENTVMRSLLLLPDADQAKLRAAAAAFAALWHAGKIDGPEMAAALCDWIALLRGFGIEPSDDVAHAALVSSFGRHRKEADALFKCDPKTAAFLDLLRNAEATCGKAGVA